MSEKTLPEGFRFVDLNADEFNKHWDQWASKIFDDESTILDYSKVLSKEEFAQMRALGENMKSFVRIRIGIFKGEEFCGWFCGDQYSHETFYMRNSAILPQFRKLGLYSALLAEVLRRVKALGFQTVLSRHTTTNNAIIIPKLKAGFLITAMEVSDRFGTLVHLTYYFNPVRRDVMIFRAGDLKPSAQIKDALGIS